MSASLRFLSSGLDYHRRLLDKWLPSSGVIGDIGCGQGRVALFYDRPGRRTLGIDRDHSVVVAASRVGSARFVAGDAFALPLRDASLDAMVGLGIMELDPQGPEHFLGEACRVLTPGGILYLSVPFLNVGRRFGRVAEWAGRPVRSFDERIMRDLVSAAGFRTLLSRPSSLAWGLGPFHRLAHLSKAALVQEREDTVTYRILFPLFRFLANSLVVIAKKRMD